MMSKRKIYEEKLETQLDQWGLQVALFKARADKDKAEVKIKYYKTIEALQHRQDEVRTKLHELKTAGDEAWEDLKTGAEKVWAEVKTVFHKAEAEFK